MPTPRSAPGAGNRAATVAAQHRRRRRANWRPRDGGAPSRGKAPHLALLLVAAGAHAQQAAQQEEVDLQLGEHIGQRAHLAKHLFVKEGGKRVCVRV